MPATVTARLHAMTRRPPSTVRRAAAALAAASFVVAAGCSGPRGVLADAATAPTTLPDAGSSTSPTASNAGASLVGAPNAATTTAATAAPSTAPSKPTTEPTFEPTTEASTVAVAPTPADDAHTTLPLSEAPTGGPAARTEAPAPGSIEPVTHVATLNGRERTWLVVAPAAAETSRPRPLVIVLHGLAADGAVLQRALGFDPLADGTDAVLAYPSAIDGAWNDERPNVTSSSAHRDHVDDAAFLDHIIDTAVAENRVDPGRVAVVGFSNGGMMAAYYACVHADRVRAVALVAGAGGSGLPGRCAPSRPVSVLTIHSRRDPVVPFLGGPIAADTGRWGSSAPVAEMLDRWRAVAACHGVVDRSLGNRSPVVVEQHAFGCAPGVEIVLDRVESRVHGWLSEPTFMTTDIVWQFVVEHTRVPA